MSVQLYQYLVAARPSDGGSAHARQPTATQQPEDEVENTSMLSPNGLWRRKPEGGWIEPTEGDWQAALTLPRGQMDLAEFLGLVVSNTTLLWWQADSGCASARKTQ